MFFAACWHVRSSSTFRWLITSSPSWLQIYSKLLKYWVWRSWIVNYRKNYAYILNTSLLSSRCYSRIISMIISRSFAKEFRSWQMSVKVFNNHNHNVLFIKKKKADDLVCIAISEEIARIDEAKRKSLTRIKAKTFIKLQSPRWKKFLQSSTKKSKSIRWLRWRSETFIIQFRCLRKSQAATM